MGPCSHEIGPHAVTLHKQLLSGQEGEMGTQVDASEFVCNMWFCYLAVCGQAQK